MTAELRFEPEQHRYFFGQIPMPSVTQVLDRENDYGGVPPETLEAARQFGTHVHEANFLMLRHQLEWRTLDPSLVSFVSAARKFILEQRITVLAAELRLCDPDLRFAGTLDVLGVWKHNEWIFDWKSASTMPRTAPLQLAAYDHLYKKNYGGRPRKRAGVQLKADGTYAIHPYADPRDMNLFLSALNLWHWRNRT
jgi:hypothetical protein